MLAAAATWTAPPEGGACSLTGGSVTYPRADETIDRINAALADSEDAMVWTAEPPAEQAAAPRLAPGGFIGDPYIYGGTAWEVDGPYAEWSDTGRRFTSEIKDVLREAIRTQTPPPCPACGELVDQVEMETVAAQKSFMEPFAEFGRLVTLKPCGCRFKD
jgi:hypothetical protein